jgi:hypothetical protein
VTTKRSSAQTRVSHRARRAAKNISTFGKSKNGSCESLIPKIHSAIMAFSGNNQFDDLALVLARAR